MARNRLSPSGPPLLGGTLALPAVQINAGAKSVLTVAAPGARVGDSVAFALRAALNTGLVVAAWGIYAVDVLSIEILNPTAGNITPTANTFDWQVLPRD